MNKLIVFDVDGTLIRGNSWLSLNLAAGITKDEDYALYKAYGEGTLTYDDWTKELVRLYKERGVLNKSVAESALTTYELVPGATELINKLHELDFQTAIITGSFDITAEAIKNELGLTYVRAVSSLSFDSEGEFKTIVSKGEEGYAKVALLESLCNELGITPKDCVCIGDGGNVVELFKITGHGITFTTSSDTIKQHAEYIVDSLVEVTGVIV